MNENDETCLKEETEPMNWMKRLAALLMALCLLGTTVVLAEDEEISIEDVILTEDGEEVTDPDAGDDAFEAEVEAIFDMSISSEQQAALDELEQDTELDTSINPDDLEMNPNLPDNVVNILLIGIDTRDTKMDSGLQNGDVQLILSIDKNTGSVKLSSLLRDMYVTIPGYKNKNRINVAYGRGGGALAMRTVNHNFEMNIEHYVAINFYGLASIIDAIGGIDVDMTKIEAGAVNTYLRKHPPKYDNTDGEARVPLERVAGVQHLDGVQAVMYARLREIDNDFSRTARQRHLLELLLSKIMQDMTLDKLITLMETCMPYVMTNVNASTMASLGMTVLQSGIVSRAQNGEELIEQFRVPMDKAYSYKDINGASVIYMGTSNFPKNVQALHEFIYGAYYPANGD